MSASEETTIESVTESLTTLSIETKEQTHSQKQHKKNQNNQKKSQTQQKQQPQKQQPQKQKKPLKTVYWGIEVDTATILAHEPVKKSMEENPQLVPQPKMHTTLLFVGRKDDEREKLFLPHKDQECLVTVDAHGISKDALALRVSSLQFVDDSIKTEVVPAFPNKIQHVTVALSPGTKAVNSIESFEQGTTVEYDTNLVLTGKMTQYFF